MYLQKYDNYNELKTTPQTNPPKAQPTTFHSPHLFHL